jgi:hypothetical protein
MSAGRFKCAPKDAKDEGRSADRSSRPARMQAQFAKKAYDTSRPVSSRLHARHSTHPIVIR